MTTDVALGIDFGTSGVRIAATDAANTLKAMSAAPITAPIQTGLGRAWQDPAIWWDALIAAFKGLNLEGLSVRAIAIDGTSGTILSVTPDGTPASLASMYNDVAEMPLLALVAAQAPKETAALGSTSPLARAMVLVGTLTITPIVCPCALQCRSAASVSAVSPLCEMNSARPPSSSTGFR